MALKLIRWIATAGVFAAVLVGGLASRESWGPPTAKQLARLTEWLDPSGGADTHEHDNYHDGHSHSRDSNDAEINRIELSEQAQQNIGLETVVLQQATFARTITVPGIVIEKPGHSDVEVTAPLTGVVTQ